MKALLVGLGSAGYSWYKRLKQQDLLGAVVETDTRMKENMGTDPFPFYHSLEEALENENVDFLVNVTPPMAHTRVNHAAFDRKLPVLCEKPISFDYGESIEIVTRSLRENIPFMIAENYRRMPVVRKLKQLIESGKIGAISQIDAVFYRYHQVERKYTVSVLDDIGVHHMDMLRYFTGQEGHSVQSKLYNPIGGWQEEGAVLNACILFEMTGGIAVNYSASIAARGRETAWYGNWRIEGTEGALELIDKEIYLHKDKQAQLINDFSGVDVSDTLAEFLSSLREGRESETSGRDYLKTQALVHFAKQASVECRTVPIRMPEGD